MTETTPELREHLGGSADAGVLVSKVVKGSAAEDAGVAVGDLIVDVDGDEIGSTNDLRKALAERDGEIFDIEVIRDGRSLSLSVTLEADEEDRPTGPRAYRRVPHSTAPAFVAPRVAPQAVAPLIRERIRLAPAVVEIDAARPTLAAVPVAPSVAVIATAPDVVLAPVAVTEAVLAPLAVTVPIARSAVIAPVPPAILAPDVNVVPMLAPLPDVPAPPRPVLVVPNKDDVI